MAPRYVLLDRKVSFVRRGPLLPWLKDYDERLKARKEDMKNMKPDLDITDPPEVSRLSMVRQIHVQEIPSGIISCTDKALVLVYPGIPGTYLCKDYLVYDASCNSISVIPGIPNSLNSCIFKAAVLSRGEGSYVLAELVRVHEFHAALYLWWSTSNPERGRWIRSAVRLPSELFTPTYTFHIDMVFSYGSSSVCWVDLLKGVLICDLLNSPEPKFTFVPLPVGYCIDVPSDPCDGIPVGRPCAREFRTMGCVGGVIKFFSVVGYYENLSFRDMGLKTWTLSCDLKNWELCRPLGVADLWASKSFREKNLPQVAPRYPILNLNDAEIVNFTLIDIDYEKRVDIFGEAHWVKMVVKAQYRVSLNTVENKVISSTKLAVEDRPKFDNLIASEFSAYLQCSKDHKDHKGSKAGTSKAGTSSERKYSRTSPVSGGLIC